MPDTGVPGFEPQYSRTTKNSEEGGRKQARRLGRTWAGLGEAALVAGASLGQLAGTAEDFTLAWALPSAHSRRLACLSSSDLQNVPCRLVAAGNFFFHA